MSLETEFHTQLETRVIEWCQIHGGSPLVNFRLPTGKIADLIFVSRESTITIVEVKTSLHEYLIEEAIGKYGSYCHYLNIAAPSNCAIELMARPGLIAWPRGKEQIGVLAVGDRSVDEIQTAQRRILPSRVYDYLGYQIKERLNMQATAAQLQSRTG